MEATTTTNTKGGTKYLVELALMIAIIFVMAFTPLGYLRTPGLSITFLTVPVAVAADRKVAQSVEQHLVSQV